MTSTTSAGIVALVLAGGLAGIAPTARDVQVPLCHDQWPAWSPDGRQVVFVSTRTGDHEIFVLTLADGRTRQLTDVPGRDAHPSFSPDGSRIAFQSPRGSEHTNLYVMNADGTDQRRLTNHVGFAGMPVWSPDGERLVYQWRSEEPGAKWQLMMLTIDAGTPRALTDGSANDQVVNWAPDGRRLIFHSDRTGRNQFYVWEADEVVRLAETSYDDRNASWSPDGRRISFVSQRDDAGAGIFVMNADGSNVRRIGDLTVDRSRQVGRAVRAGPSVSVSYQPAGSNRSATPRPTCGGRMLRVPPTA